LNCDVRGCVGTADMETGTVTGTAIDMETATATSTATITILLPLSGISSQIFKWNSHMISMG